MMVNVVFHPNAHIPSARVDACFMKKVKIAKSRLTALNFDLFCSSISVNLIKLQRSIDLSFACNLDHQNCPTSRDYERSILSSKKEMEEGNKWSFSRSYSEDGIQNKCQKKIGEVSTTFEGYGKARLRYRPCEEGGNVQVYIDNEEHKGKTDENTGIQTVDFDFNSFTTLKIEEGDNSMVNIISLDLGCRGI